MGRHPVDLFGTAEDRIMDALARSYHGNGVWQTDLMRMTALSRDHIYTVTKKLGKEGMIIISRHGRRAKYMITTKAFTDSEISFSLMTELAYQRLLSPENKYPTVRPSTENLGTWLYRFYSEKFPDLLPKAPPIPNISMQTKQGLRVLAERFGVLLVYSLIYLLEDLATKPNKKFISNFEKNVFFIRSLEGLFHNISLRIPLTFFHWFQFFSDLDSIRGKQIASFTFTKETVEALKKAFSKAYPELSHELEAIKNDLPRLLEDKQVREAQSRCSHDFLLVTKKLTKERQLEKRCRNCGFTKISTRARSVKS